MRVYPSGQDITVTEQELAHGITHIECPACNGTGTFSITNQHSQDCVRCSTRGTIAVTL